jgi:hypothetical protein
MEDTGCSIVDNPTSTPRPELKIGGITLNWKTSMATARLGPSGKGWTILVLIPSEETVPTDVEAEEAEASSYFEHLVETVEEETGPEIL